MSAPTPVAAIVDANSKVRSLIRTKEPDVRVTPSQLDDRPWLARLLTRITRDVAQLERRAAPRRIDFEDVAVDATGTTPYRFVHNFAGRVRWWVVDAQTAAPALIRSDLSDNDTLVLISMVACTVTIRVEEAG